MTLEDLKDNAFCQFEFGVAEYITNPEEFCRRLDEATTPEEVYALCKEFEVELQKEVTNEE
jgi:hypothetical protein